MDKFALRTMWATFNDLNQAYSGQTSGVAVPEEIESIHLRIAKRISLYEEP